MQEVAGVNGAGTIWRAIMDAFHAGRPIEPFKQPGGVVTATICADTGALAGDACPNRMDEKFVAGTEPKTSDVFFKTLKVAGDGSCLAATYSPASEVREQRFIVYPLQYQAWAAAHGIAQPPTNYCPPPRSQPNTAIALISRPSASTTITGTQVLVRGTARGAYTLEWGSGSDPTAWQSISQGAFGVVDGILGVWRTADLAPGDYVLRLRVTTPDGIPIESKTSVRVAR
jgi:hypothetical protein